MDLVFDTLDGHSMEFNTDGCTLTRTGVASKIPAKAQSDPLVLLRAFQAVVRRVSPAYPGVIGSHVTKVILRPAKGTDQAQFAITYEGPPQSKPQSRWVVEDSSTLASEKTELDLNGNVLLVEWQPPGKQDAGFLGPPGMGGIPTYISGQGKAFDKVYHSGDLNVLRPRRQISISGWIIGRPGSRSLGALDCVNSAPLFGLPAGFWLVTAISATNENAAKTPFPEATMVYHVKAAMQSRVLYDWSSYLIYKNKFGIVPKELGSKEEAKKRLAILKQPYSIDQVKGNGFLKVGMYYPKNIAGLLGI